MKKHHSIALVLALSAVLLTGCRRPMDNGMTAPSTGAGDPTVSTTLPRETLMTEPTTVPTQPSTEHTRPTHDVTEPHASDPTNTTDTTQDTKARGRNLPRS